jgi:hypothetical protein
MFANWEEQNSGVSGEFPIFLEVGTAKAIRKHNRLLPRGKMQHRRPWLRLAGRLEEGKEALVVNHADGITA